MYPLMCLLMYLLMCLLMLLLMYLLMKQLIKLLVERAFFFLLREQMLNKFFERLVRLAAHHNEIYIHDFNLLILILKRFIFLI